jgi:hypothetical protein
MSLENHEARIAALEQHLKRLLQELVDSQKLSLALIKSDAQQASNLHSLFRLVVQMEPDLATPEITGMLHNRTTENEFFQDQLDNLKLPFMESKSPAGPGGEVSLPEDSADGSTLIYTEGNPAALLVTTQAGQRTSAPMPFPTAEAALAWCREHGTRLLYLPPAPPADQN